MKKRKSVKSEENDENIKRLLDGGASLGRKLTMGEQMESLLQENESLRILARKLYRENKELKMVQQKKQKTAYSKRCQTSRKNMVNERIW